MLLAPVKKWPFDVLVHTCTFFVKRGGTLCFREVYIATFSLQCCSVDSIFSFPGEFRNLQVFFHFLNAIPLIWDELLLRNSSIYDSKATLQNNLKGEKRFFKIVSLCCKWMVLGDVCCKWMLLGDVHPLIQNYRMFSNLATPQRKWHPVTTKICTSDTRTSTSTTTDPQWWCCCFSWMLAPSAQLFSAFSWPCRE